MHGFLIDYSHQIKSKAIEAINFSKVANRVDNELSGHVMSRLKIVTTERSVGAIAIAI